MEQSSRKDTRAALIEAAERLLATRGFGGVTAVEITKEASARNTSAVRYHFGNMENLIRAVFESRLEALDSYRMKRLSALDKDGRGYNLYDLVDLIMHPLMEACDHASGRRYALILSQLTTDPRFDFEEWAGDHEPKSLAMIKDRMQRCLGDLPPTILSARLRRLNIVAAGLLADYARQVEKGAAPNVGEATDEVTVALAAFLAAPIAPPDVNPIAGPSN
ncbi:MAG: helix-turn-helix domain-containing protein [Pseudomonadota bacterium]